jgi:hypothetical protein
MKFPVFSQLAGNLGSETGSLKTPSSSGESVANLILSHGGQLITPGTLTGRSAVVPTTINLVAWSEWIVSASGNGAAAPPGGFTCWRIRPLSP